MSVKLTSFSHGAGCGCKLSPQALQEILSGAQQSHFTNLLVGNDTKDDAAVYNLDDKTAIISTTDFFTPIVDDPTKFGAIAATNAISDIYAMGGKPIMAIAILGWPIDKIPLDVAKEVLDGAKEVCSLAGIPLAGGHSIDVPEPIFGLAVTGQAPINQIRKNSDGKVSDLLYLTKPIGVGLVTTAQKRDLADSVDLNLAEVSMLKLNNIGEKLAPYSHIHAITDVTGFGLAGHLIELAEGSQCSAEVNFDQIPQFPFVQKYLDLKTIPGGTKRNWDSYSEKVKLKNTDDFKILADPQTSGGLLISVDPNYQVWFEDYMRQNDFDLKPIGQLIAPESEVLIIK